MHYNLNDLLIPVPNLDQLAHPFTNEEIDSIVENLPSEKSLGPDGFNTDFMKKCWKVISSNFYDLCAGFYNMNICLQSINGSFIVLVAKKDNPSS
jgi:hypothetical protein